MPVLANDPLTWAMISMGWMFIGSCFVVLAALVLKLGFRMLGILGKGRWWPLLIAELILLIGLIVVNAQGLVASPGSWPDIAISYAPLAVAPLLVGLTCVVASCGSGRSV